MLSSTTMLTLALFLAFSAVNALAPRAVYRSVLSRTTQSSSFTRPQGSAYLLERDSSVVTITMSSPPAVVERKVGGSGPAVLEPPQTERRRSTETDEPVKDRRGMGHEAWEVRIYNDGLNTREHVARSLVQVTGMSEMSAYQTMMQAHQNGIAVVGRWVYEVAEMYHDALRQNGIICDIVPVEEE
ncbi:hypothetical protein ACA910_013982 [Epithemia clementina (nom. ined.)]